MSAEWKLVLDEEALNVLLACRLPERTFLLNALGSLRNDPYQSGDYVEHDDSGRPLQAKLLGRFLITYWPDHAVTEMRVVDIERVRLNF